MNAGVLVYDIVSYLLGLFGQLVERVSSIREGSQDDTECIYKCMNERVHIEGLTENQYAIRRN